MFNGFNQPVGADTSSHRAQDVTDRRRFLRLAVLAGVGTAGVGALGATAGTAFAGAEAERRGPSDIAVLNYLLELEYLNAEFFLRGAFGTGLDDELVGGAGRVGRSSVGRAVTFTDPRHRQYQEEIAADERAQVAYLRGLLGPARVGRAELDLAGGFSAVAAAAGLVDRGRRFDAFAGEDTFLLGAFMLADLSVTAYRGALPLLSTGAFLDGASGVLATQAHHAALVRTVLLDRKLEVPAGAISDARISLDGRVALDQGVVVDNGRVNIVPADGNGLVASRAPGRVLNIVFQSPRSVTSGGFFPRGVNGEINRSDGAA